MSNEDGAVDRRGLVRLLGATAAAALLGVGVAQNGHDFDAGPNTSDGTRGQSVILYGPDGQPLPTFTKADPGSVQLVRGSVTIAGTRFHVGAWGETLMGNFDDRPAAADAHAALPFCYFLAADTGGLYQTNGTSWRTVA